MSARRRGPDGPPHRGWHRLMMTREDIGYGPAQPYEFGYGPAMVPPRERRRTGPRRPEPRVPGLGPYAARLRRRRRPDAWIRCDVEESLFLDTWVDADRITVEVDHGVVTLVGTLAHDAEILRAVATAARAHGVRSVRNRLELEA